MRLAQLVTEKSKPVGAFVGVRFSDKTNDELIELIEGLEVDNPTKIDALHCTVMYTEKEVPELLDYSGQQFDPPLIATPHKFEIFESSDGNKCLVLRVKCDKLFERHENIKSEYGAVYTHKEYKPHITLSYNCNNFTIDQSWTNKIVKEIEIVEEYVNPLDSDWGE